jgi:hypothetical protein
MVTYLFYGLLVYLLYRFVFHFLLPVIRVASKVKQQMNGMRTASEQQFRNQSQANSWQSEPSSKPSSKGDYIDFEEVK